jgi:hypothetical protein
MHLPPRAIEPSNKLDHLPLGAAGIQARHYERNRHGIVSGTPRI